MRGRRSTSGFSEPAPLWPPPAPAPPAGSMKLVISIDVEEEGLFSGHYPRTPPGVANVGELHRLEFIPREFGFPLTLLVTYPVARDQAACQVLARWRDRYRAEIGVHLHPWNTPPFLDPPQPEPVPSERLPQALLRDKLARLVNQVHTTLEVAPHSFRMGRFDWGPKVMALLPEFNLVVDSSVVPLTQKRGGRDNFLAPPHPFFLQAGGPAAPPLLEAPLTMVPIWPGAARLVYRWPAPLGARLRDWFRYVGAVGIQPAWYPLPSMRLAARLHRARGGQVLTMFFHSSELKPGASRLFPTERAVNRFVGKISAFLAWLVQTGPVAGVTLADLGAAPPGALPEIKGLPGDPGPGGRPPYPDL